MNDKPARPAWFARREISPFVLDDSAVNEVIGKASHAVVSWVTKDNQPVSAVMLYVLVDNGDGQAEKVVRRLHAAGVKRVAILTGGEQTLSRQGQAGQVIKQTGKRQPEN